ncbi:MAG: hypothetical protein WDN28_15355 [Chthoniobacter sp.]
MALQAAGKLESHTTVSLFVGGILFIMSGGSPWSTAGTMNAIMGAILPVGMFTLLVLHFALSFLYVAVIAHVIYRLRPMSGILVGVCTGLALYGVNFIVFHPLATQMQSPEGRALFVHITFSLLASAAYKGGSVPRPFRGSRDEVLDQTHRLITEENPADPEPVTAAADR